MPSFVNIQYDTLDARHTRVLAFYPDLEAKLSAIGAPYTVHLELYWDGGKVRRISDDVQISSLPPSDQLKYYNHALGLMKLAINAQLYA